MSAFAIPVHAIYEELFDAAEKGEVEPFQRMEGNTAFDINFGGGKLGTTYLMGGAVYGRQPFVSYLLGRGAIVDKRNEVGWTALLLSVNNDHVEVSRLLLESGADPSVQPYDKEKFAFPIYNAVQHNNPEMCELLLKHGADIDMKYNGMTSLQHATRNPRKVHQYRQDIASRN